LLESAYVTQTKDLRKQIVATSLAGLAALVFGLFAVAWWGYRAAVLRSSVPATV